MKYFRIICIISCIFICLPMVAFGYVATLSRRISIIEEYSDNMFLSNENEVQDFFTTISPGVSLHITGKNTGAEFSYDPSYTWYNDHSAFNSFRHHAQCSVRSDFTKNTRLDISDTFIRTEEPLSDEDTTIRRSRDRYYSNTSRLNIAHQFGESDSIWLGYMYSILQNDAPELSDNTRHNPSAGIMYWFSPQIGIETTASYTRGEFEPPDNFDNWNGNIKIINRLDRHFEWFAQYVHVVMDFDEGDDYQIFNPSLGLNYSPGEETMLSLSVGYYKQEWEEYREAEAGMVIESNISQRWIFRRGSINLSGSSGYQEAYFGAENLGFDIFYQVTCSVVYEFSSNLSSNIYSSYRSDQYKNIEPERDDETVAGGAGLTWQLRRWLNITFDCSYRNVNSTIVENDYDEFRGLMRVSVTPARQIPLVRE